jgi:hypothetical protein
MTASLTLELERELAEHRQAVTDLEEELVIDALGEAELEDAIRSLLALFDRGLPAGSLGSEVCGYARSLLTAPTACPECASSSPCSCDLARWL